jgi:hypothetical protein
MAGAENEGQMVGQSRLRAHVVFSRQSNNEPSLLTLADLVTVMHDESRYYRPLSVGFIPLVSVSKSRFSFFE